MYGCVACVCGDASVLQKNKNECDVYIPLKKYCERDSWVVKETYKCFKENWPKLRQGQVSVLVQICIIALFAKAKTIILIVVAVFK